MKGPWRAETPALAKTGHAVTFTAPPYLPKHHGGQIQYRGDFSTYPKHKGLLGTTPTPMFSDGNGFGVGKDQCLIPVVINMRDSGVSRSAVLVDPRAGSLRFVTEQAYRWTGKGFELTTADLESFATRGAPGRWLRGAAVAEAPSCKPADFNGRWDRSDGAKITIRGAGTDGVGGTASMDENPGDWVRGQDKYVSMRMKSACVYTAKCFASQRTMTNGRPDFKMIETACELVLDPVKQVLRERGTSNTYVYTKAGAAAARKPQPAAAEALRTPEPALPSAAVQSLNAAQADAARREAAAYAASKAEFEARKKAIAAQQAAQDAAYRKSLADHQARVAAHEAQVADMARKAAEDQAKWRAAVAACKAGDKSQCAPMPQ